MTLKACTVYVLASMSYTGMPRTSYQPACYMWPDFNRFITFYPCNIFCWNKALQLTNQHYSEHISSQHHELLEILWNMLIAVLLYMVKHRVLFILCGQCLIFLNQHAVNITNMYIYTRFILACHIEVHYI